MLKGYMAKRATFGLDKIIVERRSLGPTQPFFVTLPPPISVNAMFGQAPGRRRFPTAEYNAWKEDAALRLKAARPPSFPGQVWISIVYSEASRFDTDNAHKGILDLLVQSRVIKDDSKKYVRELRLSWGNNAGARVEIRPYSFSETRSAA